MELTLEAQNPGKVSAVPGPHLFNFPHPSSDLVVSVIVPVKDEAQHLFATLEALRMQEGADKLPLNHALYEVLVLVNNSTDTSFAIAQAYQLAYPDFRLLVAEIHLPFGVAHIGTVRRQLMDAAHARLSAVGRKRGIIASTDGDSLVDRQWIHYIITEIAKGNDAVGGRIYARDPDPLSSGYLELNDTYQSLVTQVESLIDPVAHDPWPRHFQYFGANLAVTFEMYEKVGRMPAIPFLEDEAFHRALYARDAKIRRSPQVKVYTSARLDGRVPIGFSEQLTVWKEMVKHKQLQYAESGNDVIARYTRRKLLRNYWCNMRSTFQNDYLMNKYVTKILQMDIEWLNNQAEASTYFGEFWHSVEEWRSAQLKKSQPELITTAIMVLTDFVNIFQKHIDPANSVRTSQADISLRDFHTAT